MRASWGTSAGWWTRWSVLIAAAGAQAAAPPVPRQFTMQGVTTGYSSPVSIGVRFFDASSGGTNLWSETHSSVALTSDGVFSLNVGSQTVGGIPDSAFAGSEVWVELTFNSTDTWPRTQLLAVPFALKSIYAEQLVKPDSMDAVVTVDSDGKVAVGSRVGMGTDDTDDKGFMTLSNQYGEVFVLDGQVDTSTISARMTFLEPVNGQDALRLDGWSSGGGGQVEVLDADELLTIRLRGDTGSGGTISMFDAAGHATVVLTSEDGTNGGGALLIRNSVSDPTVILDGDNGNGAYQDGSIHVYNGAGGVTNMRTAVLDGSDSENGHDGHSNLELYDASGCLACRLHSDREADAGSLALFAGSCGQGGLRRTVDLRAAENAGEAGFLALTNLSEVHTVVLDGDDELDSTTRHSGLLSVRSASDVGVIRMSAARRNGEAELTMFQTNDSGVVKEAVILQAQDNNGGGSLHLKGPVNGDTDISLVAGASGLGYHGRISLYDNSGDEVVQIRSGDASLTGGTIELRDTAANRRIGLYANYNGTGVGRIITGEIEITGADLAEKFPASETLEPGMVVAIDPLNPGKLCLARGAYNRCVAGVVSGANGLGVGAILGNLPGLEDSPPIALSGRVWVQCDAAHGAIQPGDLLTTSDAPGRAMRADDPEHMLGAVLGKAMTSLPSGTGFVLVLVNLQ